MATITVVPDDPRTSPRQYRAVAGDRQSVGPTVGQAIDALTAQLGAPAETTLVVVQPMRPDGFFTGEQGRRLEDLMARWRAARDAGQSLPPDERAELDDLVRAELQAAADRAAALVRPLAP